MEWKDLERMTVSKLREEALKHPDQIKGVHGKNKAQLMNEVARIMGIEQPHVSLTQRVVHTRESLKTQIRELKVQRDNLIEAHKSRELHGVRRQIHKLKRQIRRIELQNGARSKAKTKR